MRMEIRHDYQTTAIYDDLGRDITIEETTNYLIKNRFRIPILRETFNQKQLLMPNHTQILLH